MEQIKKELKFEIINQLKKTGQLVVADQKLVPSETNIDNSQNNNGIINNNNYFEIKLNPFEKTDMSILKDIDYVRCIKKGNLGIPHLVYLLHFNEDHPENHNIFINNIKSPYVSLFGEKKWNYEMQYESLNMMIENYLNMIEEKLEKWHDNKHRYLKRFKLILDKFPHFLNKYYTSKYVKNRVHEETKLKIFNNKHIPINTKKKLLKIKEKNNCI